MSSVRVHYAPHHNDHLPLCGWHPDRPGLTICSTEAGNATCIPCLDIYDERLVRDEQEMDRLLDQVTDLSVRYVNWANLNQRTPWWNVIQRRRLERAWYELECERLSLGKP